MASSSYQCQKCGKKTEAGSWGPPNRECSTGGLCVWRKLGRFIKQLFD